MWTMHHVRVGRVKSHGWEEYDLINCVGSLLRPLRELISELRLGMIFSKI